MKAMTFFISQNKCIGCCVVCENHECPLCGSYAVCSTCKNNKCVNNSNYTCNNYYGCGFCKNIHCVNHERFNPKQTLLKNC